MEIHRRRAVIFLLFTALHCAPAISGEIAGKAAVAPPYPEPQVFEAKAKDGHASCEKAQRSNGLRVSKDGGVENVVVELSGDFPADKHESEIKVLDQKDCRFEPHVVLLPPGAKLEIRNSDPFAHDIRAFDKDQMLFRYDMNEGERRIEGRLSKPGRYTIRCGFHPWMYAFVIVQPHSFFAVTDISGAFKLKDVPDGRYSVHLWHEILGEALVSAEAKPDITNLNYTYHSPEKGK